MAFLQCNKDFGSVMDKKIHQITKKMKTAEKDIKKNQPQKAKEVLKKAEKQNEVLKRIDRDERDPIIEKYNKMKGKC